MQMPASHSSSGDELMLQLSHHDRLAALQMLRWMPFRCFAIAAVVDLQYGNRPT
eukprot:SAG31_NODE_2814_length_5047_cov_3.149555_3_plen_54_part_00